MDKPKAFMHWSSGKDATMALSAALVDGYFEVDKLLTTVNRVYGRVTMHGLRIELLEAQASCLGVSLELVELEADASMASYEKAMNEKWQQLVSQGYEHTFFGDIFLEDLRNYREKTLRHVGIKGVFPLWKKDTRQLLKDFIEAGYKAIVVCASAQVLPQAFCGRVIDEDFLRDLPSEVDPCGENGEFHTFCFDGPLFKQPIPFEKGEVVYKTYPAPKTKDGKAEEDYGFWYCDLKLK